MGTPISEPARWIIAIHVGSTTTKGACLCRRPVTTGGLSRGDTGHGLAATGGLDLLAVEHAPTTVEKPFEDVSFGLDEVLERLVSKNRGFVYLRQFLPTIAKESPPAVVPIPAQGVPESTLREFMLVREGDRVQSGQALVSLNALRLYRRDYGGRGAPTGGGCIAPVDGVVEKVDLRRLTVTIEPAVTQTAITAGIPGVVSAVHRNGIDMMMWGEVFTGVYGTGGEALGPLTFGAEPGSVPGPGAVWVLPGRVTASQLGTARANGVRAIWAASAAYEDLRSFLSDRPLGTVSLAGTGPVLVISEGFGDLSMPPRVAAALAASAGRAAAVNGDTQLRAGVIRPELRILHDGAPAAPPFAGRTPERPAPEPRPLGQDDLVRCTTGRNLGRTGRVAAAPRPGLLPSGVRAELAEVAWDGGGRDTVAARNLARVSGEWGHGDA